MSSVSEPSDSDDYISQKEKIIQEVRKRPPLWDKKVRDYKDKTIQGCLWSEVCKKVAANYDSLSEQQKKKEETSIRKQWKNMKDYFIKELNARKFQTGPTSFKKRKYVHFDSLLFLVPTIPNACFVLEDMRKTEKSDKTNDSPEPKRRKQHEETTEKERTQAEITRERADQKYDEDINFTQMLVPMLRKLNEEQKHYAKIEILNVLRRAKSHRAEITIETDIAVKTETLSPNMKYNYSS